MRLHPYGRAGRLLFRAPVLLYRLGLGWLLGSRFMLLTHVGRKTGRRHSTVVEVVGHEPSTDTFYVVSGFGRRADWFRNVLRNPGVEITVGGRRARARAYLPPEEEAMPVFRAFCTAHPTELRIMLRLFGCPPVEGEEDMRAFLKRYPVVAFKVESAKNL